MAKYIFVTGGVVSSLGKGITAASLGRLLKSRGYSVFMQKFDPYINIDPGTMSPYQHGEVYVTEDGAETDLDLGHYERFIDVNLSQSSNVTTGKIYSQVLEKERRGDYLGKTVQVIPHITDQIMQKVFDAANESRADIIITEVGGTVGDIESLPFLEAIRQVKRVVGANNVTYIHTTLVPYLKAAGEIKTKPTQHSVKALNQIGINPDFIVLRSEVEIDEAAREKISVFCNVQKCNVIKMLDAKSIYHVPIYLKEQRMDELVLEHFGLEKREIDLSEWEDFLEHVDCLDETDSQVNIAIVGKYVSLEDAYLSINESLFHAATKHCVKVNKHFIDAEKLDDTNVIEKLAGMDGVLVPGGFGYRAAEGKISAIKYARENNIPFFGICFGMQLAMIEYARNVLNIKDATSTEFFENATEAIIDYLPDQYREINLGGTMRLGKYDCLLDPKSKVRELYNEDMISERHRHRYEFNNKYWDSFQKSSLRIVGINQETKLAEIIEHQENDFFIAVQFHPELKSRPTNVHPIFSGFVKACMKK